MYMYECGCTSTVREVCARSPAVRALLDLPWCVDCLLVVHEQTSGAVDGATAVALPRSSGYAQTYGADEAVGGFPHPPAVIAKHSTRLNTLSLRHISPPVPTATSGGPSGCGWEGSGRAPSSSAPSTAAWGGATTAAACYSGCCGSVGAGSGIMGAGSSITASTTSARGTSTARVIDSTAAAAAAAAAWLGCRGTSGSRCTEA